MQSRSKLIMLVWMAAVPRLWAEAPADRPTFVNPVYEGADPWVTRHGDFYYYCRSEGDLAISVSKSDRLTDPGIKRMVWKCPERGWNSRQLWAPELHHMAGKWYIYYAASDGRNENHRAGVLESVSDDPQGEYIDRGELYTGDRIDTRAENRWAIDATPVTIDGKLYVIWSGWPDTRDVQYLYIAPMENPYTVAGNRVRICANDTYLWERVGETEHGRGLHEAPQVLYYDEALADKPPVARGEAAPTDKLPVGRGAGKASVGRRVLVVYSCSGSWEPSYKLGLVSMREGDDPLDPASWRKHPRPIFVPTEQTFGIGHCSFVTSPDGTEHWIVYHAKRSREHGWERAVFLQPFRWTAEGLPDFGKPVAAGEVIPIPSGERPPRPGEKFVDEFEDGNWDRWRYFGYSRYVWAEDGAFSLGSHPKWGLVNQYRSGEKALVRDLEWTDLTASVRLRFVQGSRDAGILFRVREPAVGYDAQKGYFAGLIAASNAVILGKTDGKNWTEIARAQHPFNLKLWHELRVDAHGEQIAIRVDGREVLTARDSQYRTGAVGLRVVDTHAVFDNFRVEK